MTVNLETTGKKKKNVLIEEDIGRPSHGRTVHLYRLAGLRPFCLSCRAPESRQVGPTGRTPRARVHAERCGRTSQTAGPVVRDCGLSRGPDWRPEQSLSPGKPRGPPRPSPALPAAPPFTLRPNGRLSALAPPRPGRPRRASACAIALERPDRYGGRFGVAVAGGGVGRSRCAVDRARCREFGGNSADTPPDLSRISFPRETPPLRSPFSV